MCSTAETRRSRRTGVQGSRVRPETSEFHVNGAESEGPRFYSARRYRDDLEGTDMAIGMAKDSTDNHGGPVPHYRLSDRDVGTIATYFVCNEARALQSMQWVREAPSKLRGQLQGGGCIGLLALKKCNGVRMNTERNITDGQHWSMRMTAVRIVEDDVHDLRGPCSVMDPARLCVERNRGTA